MPASVPRIRARGPGIIFQALRGESARGGKKKPERTRSEAKLTRWNVRARAADDAGHRFLCGTASRKVDAAALFYSVVPLHGHLQLCERPAPANARCPAVT